MVTNILEKEPMHNTATETLLKQIKAGDETFLRKLYEQHRGMFAGWMVRNHQCSEDEAREIYQKAFSILYFNVKDNKINTLNSSVETYLIGIGKNLFRKSLSGKARMTTSLDEIKETAGEGTGYFERTEKNEQKDRVKQWLEKMGEPCKSVLLMAYFQKFSMEAIAHRMGYKTEAVARKKKHLCLEKLRQKVLNP